MSDIEPILPNDSPPVVAVKRRTPKPRLWPVFVAPLLAVVAAVAVQVVIGAVLAMRLMGQGREITAEAVTSEILSAPIIILTLVISQACFALATFLPARLSTVPMRQRLGFAPAPIAGWVWVAIALSGWFPGALGVLLGMPLSFLNEGNGFEKLWGEATPVQSVLLVLAISLLPGFIEEALFRGYVQTRLMKRMRPVAAILVSSALFAAAHIMPAQVLFAFPIGVWLGYLSWRIGSVIPGMFLHALLNGSWNILNLLLYQHRISEEAAGWAMVAGVCISGAGFVAALVAVGRRRGGPPTDVTVPSGPTVTAAEVARLTAPVDENGGGLRVDESRGARLVLLAGLGADQRQWHPQVKAFPDVVTPKWLEFLPTTNRRRESLTEYAARFGATLPIGPQTVLGGLSFGGMLALEIARQLPPERKPCCVVLMGSCRHPRGTNIALRLLEWISPLIPDFVLDRGRWIGAPFLGRGGGISRKDRTLLATMGREMTTDFLRCASRAIVTWPGCEDPGVPVRHIHGSRDWVIWPWGVKPDVMVPGGAHVLNLSRIEEVNAFLRGCIEEPRRR